MLHVVLLNCLFGLFLEGFISFEGSLLLVFWILDYNGLQFLQCHMVVMFFENQLKSLTFQTDSNAQLHLPSPFRVHLQINSWKWKSEKTKILQHGLHITPVACLRLTHTEHIMVWVWNNSHILLHYGIKCTTAFIVSHFNHSMLDLVCIWDLGLHSLLIYVITCHKGLIAMTIISQPWFT